jgi:hypothetical protein
MKGRTYASPAAMRAALMQRLLDRSKSTKRPLDQTVPSAYLTEDCRGRLVSVNFHEG